VIHLCGETLFAPRINRRGKCPADVPAQDVRTRCAQLRQRPGEVLEREHAVLPISDRILCLQTIEIDRDIKIRSTQRLDELRKMFPPIRAKDRSTASLVRARAALSPTIDLQPSLAFRPAIAEKSPRPPTLEIPAAPHANLFYLRKFQRPIYPAAATPARRPDVPVRMIIERDKHKWRGHLTHPKRSEMMEIPRAVDKKPREFAADLMIEVFNQSRRRGETERRSPERGVQRLDRECAGRPGVIQVEMNRSGQDSNFATPGTKATSYLLARTFRGAQHRHQARSLWCLWQKKTNNRGKNNCDERDFFCRIRDAFAVFARKTSAVLGSTWAFVCALTIIAVWAITGPAFGFSDTWQLIINTGTTIVTFLMVFLIQNTQNRDAKAVHLKLDELIRALGPARNKLVDLEKLSDDELKKFEQEFGTVRKKAEGAKEEVREPKTTASS
jgi:low affinity Fe/Cu permease